jgi:hypothetical protein
MKHIRRTLLYPIGFGALGACCVWVLSTSAEPEKGAGVENGIEAIITKLGSETETGIAGITPEILASKAADYARSEGAKQTEALKRIASSSRKPHARRFAALVLAHQERSDALYDLVAAGKMPKTAMSALSYLPQRKAAVLAASLVTRAKSDWVRARAIELVGIVGEGDLLKVIDEIAKSETNNGYLQKAVRRARCSSKNVERRAEVDSKTWRGVELQYWREVVDAPLAITDVVSSFMLAEDLKRRGVRFPVSFLEEYLEQGDLNAVAIAGTQREKKLVTELAEQIDKNPGLTKGCCMSLSMMGKEGARALFALLRPGDERRNRRILNALSQCADGEIAKKLREMAGDERYAKVKQYLESAACITEQRLKDQAKGKKE